MGAQPIPTRRGVPFGARFARHHPRTRSRGSALRPPGPRTSSDRLRSAPGGSSWHTGSSGGTGTSVLRSRCSCATRSKASPAVETRRHPTRHSHPAHQEDRDRAVRRAHPGHGWASPSAPDGVRSRNGRARGVRPSSGRREWSWSRRRTRRRRSRCCRLHQTRQVSSPNTSATTLAPLLHSA